jgi:hypothetical protein
MQSMSCNYVRSHINKLLAAVYYVYYVCTMCVANALYRWCLGGVALHDYFAFLFAFAAVKSDSSRSSSQPIGDASSSADLYSLVCNVCCNPSVLTVDTDAKPTSINDTAVRA